LVHAGTPGGGLGLALFKEGDLLGGAVFSDEGGDVGDEVFAALTA
jgi:hypothetical protein